MHDDYFRLSLWPVICLDGTMLSCYVSGTELSLGDLSHTAQEYGLRCTV